MLHVMEHARTTARTTALGLAAALVLAGCSTIGTGEDASSEDTPGTGGSSAETGGEVVLATHESFSLPKKLVRAWEQESGYTLEVRAAGDAGTLATKISLTADNPIADAVFGIDNTFASRPVEAGALAEVDPASPPPADFALEEGSEHLVPIDHASVCVNVDTDWFREQGQEPPQTLADLTDPAYEDLFVTPGAPTSSPGMAFFLATVAEFGDEWPSYWEDLLANGTKVVDGWEDAYYGDFTAAAEKGRRPIVVSYDSSPAFTVEGDRSSTEALLDTCFRQVEYAGVLEGADNPEAARALVEWLLSDEVQSALPESMYVFPVSESADVPEDWARFAPRPEAPYEVAPSEIAAQREEWLTQWQDVVTR